MTTIEKPLLVAVAAICATLATACRLSDPVFALKDLRADEPHHDDRSLVFGTIDLASWGTGDVDAVVLQKIGPAAERSSVAASRAIAYRVFRQRHLKNGHFVVQVPPGQYELSGLVSSGWGRPIIWSLQEGKLERPRVIVTRPGVYDMGAWRVERTERTSFVVTGVEAPSPEREAILRSAVAGTSWERLAGPAE